jgi:hypothetical protein
MDPPERKRKDLFARREPKQTPIVPPLRGIRNRSYIDPYAEPSYPYARTDRGKSF